MIYLPYEYRIWGNRMPKKRTRKDKKIGLDGGMMQ